MRYVIIYRQDAVLSQAGTRDATVNFGTYRSLQRHRAVFTAITTLSIFELNSSYISLYV